MANPIVTGSFSFVDQNGWIRASSLFTVSDPDGNPITQYQIFDANTLPDSGYIWINGATPPSSLGSPITISSADLASVWIHGSSTIGMVDALEVRAFDSTGAVSEYIPISLTT